MSHVLPSSNATGSLGVPHLKQLWAAAMAATTRATLRRSGEARLDRCVLDALGLGLHQTWNYLMFSAPKFENFEAWVVATVGCPDRMCVDRLQAAVNGAPFPEAVQSWLDSVEASPPVLTAAEARIAAEAGAAAVPTT